MTNKQENLIFFDEKAEVWSWINGTREKELYHLAIHTKLHKDLEKRVLPIAQMKFYFKRRGKNADK